LLVPLQIATTVPKGPLSLKANVRWLECEKSCLPARGSVSAELTIGDQSQPSASKSLIDNWSQRLPKTEAISATAAWVGPPKKDDRFLAIRWKTAGGDQADFFPYKNDAYEIANETDRKVEGGEVVLGKIVKKSEGNW